MARQAFDKIKAGLEDAVAHAKGSAKHGATHRVEIEAVDVSAVRAKMKMTQEAFAHTFGVSPATVRNWEQGRRHPEGPARVLLQVIQREPVAIMRALAR